MMIPLSIFNGQNFVRNCKEMHTNPRPPQSPLNFCLSHPNQLAPQEVRRILSNATTTLSSMTLPVIHSPILCSQALSRPLSVVALPKCVAISESHLCGFLVHSKRLLDTCGGCDGGPV